MKKYLIDYSEIINIEKQELNLLNPLKYLKYLKEQFFLLIPH